MSSAVIDAIAQEKVMLGQHAVVDCKNTPVLMHILIDIMEWKISSMMLASSFSRSRIAGSSSCLCFANNIKKGLVCSTRNRELNLSEKLLPPLFHRVILSFAPIPVSI